MKKINLEKNYHLSLYIIGICLILFIVKSILINISNDEISTLIFLGADYKTFTLGLYEFYRLLSCSLLHDGFLHLFCNMYSLLVLGSFIENIYGSYKFIIFLLTGILFGSLTCGILSANTIMIGMSAGLYCLMVIMFLDLFILRRINISNFFILFIFNLGVNFLPNVAWQGHLGGAFAGVLIYYVEYYRDTKQTSLFRSLFITLVLCGCLLFTRYLNTRNSITKYAATDQKYLYYLRDTIKSDFLLNHYNDKIIKYYMEVK